jgi:tRNA G37 N-methylase Trm5
VLEGLSATGLRSIRYALELDGVSEVHANDLDPTVVEAMRRNISLNGPDVEAKVQPHCSDARLLMLQNPYVSVLRACTSRLAFGYAASAVNTVLLPQQQIQQLRVHLR